MFRGCLELWSWRRQTTGSRLLWSSWLWFWLCCTVILSWTGLPRGGWIQRGPERWSKWGQGHSQASVHWGSRQFPASGNLSVIQLQPHMKPNRLSILPINKAQHLPEDHPDWQCCYALEDHQSVVVMSRACSGTTGLYETHTEYIFSLLYIYIEFAMPNSNKLYYLRMCYFWHGLVTTLYKI